MSTPLEVVQEFIAAFIAAWPTRDAASLASFFAEDAVYHNMPLEPVKGRDAIQVTLAAFMAMGGQVSVDINHVLADGRIVMTERVDHFVTADNTLSLPLMGVIEVDNGLITAWRDYFDLSQLVSPTADGA